MIVCRRVLVTVASLLCLTALSHTAFAQEPDEPLFSFGVIADVQFADKPDAGARHYRAALDNPSQP